VVEECRQEKLLTEMRARRGVVRTVFRRHQNNRSFLARIGVHFDQNTQSGSEYKVLCDLLNWEDEVEQLFQCGQFSPDLTIAHLLRLSVDDEDLPIGILFERCTMIAESGRRSEAGFR
jgi:hypothetical protein